MWFSDEVGHGLEAGFIILRAMELFDREETFGDDYLYFYKRFLDEERNRADVERIVESLGLGPGDKVLDVPCGHGRIANLLAERGLEVTGVDATQEFIDLARQDATERGLDVNYRVGDLRQLGVDGPFDAVVCWFTSFGYFDDPGNQDVLEEFARVLRPGGKLGIETIHHDGFVRRFTPAPFASTTFRDEDVMIYTSVFDPSPVVSRRIGSCIEVAQCERANIRYDSQQSLSSNSGWRQLASSTWSISAETDPLPQSTMYESS